MYTGMNFLPLWTAMVYPTNSGRMVERRDQVRTTFFSLAAASTAILASRCVSINGPLATDLPMAYLFLLFRVTIHLSVRLLLRVLNPRVGWPQGVTGWRPPEVLPSPPPWGWSTGFIVTPRLCGRLPSQRVRPALPSETFSWSTLPTCPTVAMHSRGTRRTSPEGSLSSAEPPSLETNCACEPADRAICAPFPGLNSMLWTIVPAGIFFMGMALPTRMSASGPDITFCSRSEEH